MKIQTVSACPAKRPAYYFPVRGASLGACCRHTRGDRWQGADFPARPQRVLFDHSSSAFILYPVSLACAVFHPEQVDDDVSTGSSVPRDSVGRMTSAQRRNSRTAIGGEGGRQRRCCSAIVSWFPSSAQPSPASGNSSTTCVARPPALLATFEALILRSTTDISIDGIIEPPGRDRSVSGFSSLFPTSSCCSSSSWRGASRRSRRGSSFSSRARIRRACTNLASERFGGGFVSRPTCC